MLTKYLMLATKLLISDIKIYHLRYRKKPGDKLKPRDIRIKIDGKNLEPTTHLKYLGILIDSHLNWKFHVDDLATKLSRSVGMIAKV